VNRVQRRFRLRPLTPERDLSACPYYRGPGICSFGCWEEPRCHTEEPVHGWPGDSLTRLHRWERRVDRLGAAHIARTRFIVRYRLPREDHPR